MISPVRMRLSRAKGFNLQEASLKLNGLPAVNIARPAPLGNPFVVGEDGTRAECVRLFRLLLGGYIAITTMASIESQRLVLTYIAENLKTLRNRNLACWCPLGAECHGDALLELFNRVPQCREIA
ncbi:MAG: DUF4326 domain-containing protein [Bryobacteraceae bacterium]